MHHGDRAGEPGVITRGLAGVEECRCRVDVVFQQPARLGPPDHVAHPLLFIPRFRPDPIEDLEGERVAVRLI